MMNCKATRKLRLKDIHNNSYDTDEILEPPKKLLNFIYASGVNSCGELF